MPSDSRCTACIRVASFASAAWLPGYGRCTRNRTAPPDPAAAKAPDLIGRDFNAERPNTKYVGDITYLPLDGGKFCYLATVIDLASRRVAGWAIAGHMRADLVTDALAAAIRTRGSLAGSIMHTDHGAQYTSRFFAEACRSAGVQRSMSAIGSSADNALAKSYNATFKRETLQGRKSWPTEREARLDTSRWLNRYNTRRDTPPRTTITDRLRERPPLHPNYAGTSRITRVQDSGSRPGCPASNLRLRLRSAVATRSGPRPHKRTTGGPGRPLFRSPEVGRPPLPW